MTYIPRDRLNTRLPLPLWRVLRALAQRWGLTADQTVRKLIADAGGLPTTSEEPPDVKHDTLLGP